MDEPVGGFGREGLVGQALGRDDQVFAEHRVGQAVQGVVWPALMTGRRSSVQCHKSATSLVARRDGGCQQLYARLTVSPTALGRQKRVARRWRPAGVMDGPFSASASCPSPMSAGG